MAEADERLPLWLPLLFLGLVVLDLIDRDWRGASINAVIATAFVLPSWRSSGPLTKGLRVACGVALVVLAVLVLGDLFA